MATFFNDSELPLAVIELVLSIPNDRSPIERPRLPTRDGCDEKYGDATGRLLEARLIGLPLTEDVVDTALITRLTPLLSAAAISADSEERSDRPPVESGLAVMSSSAAHAPVSQASVLASRLDSAETSCASCDCDSRSSSAETVPSRCSVLATQTQSYARAHAQNHTQSHTHRITHLPSAHVVLCSAGTHSSSLTVETALYPPPAL